MNLKTLRRAAVGVAATALLAPPDAQAVNAEHVEWFGYGYSNCGTGTPSGWLCSYDLYAGDCTEAAAFGTPVARCFLHVHAEVPVVPMLNAAGRLVGCSSGGAVVLNVRSYANFESTFPDFGNAAIDQLRVGEMSDVFTDGRPGLLRFTFFEQSESDAAVETWIVNGAFPGTCQRGTGFSYNSPAHGTVDVQI